MIKKQGKKHRELNFNFYYSTKWLKEKVTDMFNNGKELEAKKNIKHTK